MLPMKDERLSVKMTWDGEKIALTLEYPLTVEQYVGVKASPHALAHLLCNKAADDLLLMRIPRITIEHVLSTSQK